MKTLSKEAEQQIIEAAKQAVALVDDDDQSPDQAVERVARLHKLGAHKVRLLCCAYNTGRQTAQREAADTALGKFASFPLADAEKVIARLYPAAGQTKAASAPDPVSDQYSRPPAWPGLKKAAAFAVTEKRASALLAADRSPAEKTATAPDLQQVWADHTALRRGYESARGAHAAAHGRLLKAAGELRTYFRRDPLDRTPFAAAELAATAVHGPAAGRLLDWAYAANGLKEARAADGGALPLVRADDPGADRVGRCVAAARDVAAARSTEKRAGDALAAHALADLAPLTAAPKIEKRAADSLLPVPDRAYHDLSSVAAFLPAALICANKEKRAADTIQPVWDLLNGEPPPVTEKAAGNVSNWAVGSAVARGVGGALDRALGGPPADEAVHDAYLDLEDPAHDAQLRQIRTQAMLSDLMNDEDLAGHSPEAVAKAYNEIAQMAPRTSQSRLPTLTLLRRHLQGRLEPHEVQQVTGIESGIMGTHAAVPEGLQPTPRPKPPGPPGPPGQAPPPKAAGDSLNSPYLIEPAPDYGDSLLV